MALLALVFLLTMFVLAWLAFNHLNKLPVITETKASFPKARVRIAEKPSSIKRKLIPNSFINFEVENDNIRVVRSYPNLTVQDVREIDVVPWLGRSWVGLILEGKKNIWVSFKPSTQVAAIRYLSKKIALTDSARTWTNDNLHLLEKRMKKKFSPL